MKHLLGLSAAALLTLSPLETGAEKTNDSPSSAEETRIRKRCRAVGQRVRDKIHQALSSTVGAWQASHAGQHAEQQCLRRNGFQPLRSKTVKKPPDDSSGNQSTRIIF